MLMYYNCEGLGGLWWAMMRKVLWRPRDWYRSVVWWLIKRRTGGNPVYKLKDGLRLTLSPQDWGISRELAVDGKHEPFGTELLLQIIQTGWVVVDVGANIGYYALQEAKKVGPSGKVIAIEPDPDNYRLLAHNVETNGLTNIVLYQCAVSDRGGVQTFYLYPQSNYNSLLPHPGWFRSVDVEVKRLDQLLINEHQIDLIRMDIEGFECKALPGMVQTLRRHKPLLFIELHPSLVGVPAIVDLLEFLQSMNYQIKCAIHRMKDELFMGRVFADGGKVREHPTIQGFMSDERLIVYKENFTVLFGAVEEH